MGKLKSSNLAPGNLNVYSVTKCNLDAFVLKQVGCEKIFKDVISDTCKSRPGLDEALNYCRLGDTESGLGIGSTGVMAQALN